jgi:glucuronoarabinoxylan endo-1,4-beta-xylanase
MTDGLQWADKIHRFLSEANVNAWIWWFLTDMPREGEGRDNAALTDIDGNIPKRAYVTAQWSRFVRPGWIRIGASSTGNLEVTAFRSPDTRTFAIVAVNQSILPTAATFILNGFIAASVTPSITSSRWSTSTRNDVSVHESKFDYFVPARSVITFSGNTVH